MRVPPIDFHRRKYSHFSCFKYGASLVSSPLAIPPPPAVQGFHPPPTPPGPDQHLHAHPQAVRVLNGNDCIHLCPHLVQVYLGTPAGVADFIDG